MEFAEALQLKADSVFVKQMFALCDRNDDGYISYAEFIDVLVLLSKGLLSPPPPCRGEYVYGCLGS